VRDRDMKHMSMKLLNSRLMSKSGAYALSGGGRDMVRPLRYNETRVRPCSYDV